MGGMMGFSEGDGAAAMIAVPPPINLDGSLGPVCRLCDGWGYMLKIKGGGPCEKCRGTGIALRLRDLPQVKDMLEQSGFYAPGLSDAERLAKVLDIKASRQFWSEQIWWATASGTAVANTTTETILFPNVTLPANYMQDGRTLNIAAQGQHSTLGSGTVTLTFRLRWGGVSGTVICITGAITQLISLTAAFWNLNILVQTRSNGSAGTVMGNGTALVFGATAPTIGSATGAPAVSPMTAGGQITPAVATLDLTADTALSLSLQHGAASASNTATGLNYTGISEN